MQYFQYPGTCDGANYWPPKCFNCTQSMGDSCQYDCIHGKEFPPFSTQCVCDPCYSGFSCNVECTNNGFCSADANGTNVSVWSQHFCIPVVFL
ncbi:hypothetical protein DPMN_117973 [Dreissena polymorpha]|uniref:Uncharacterized protein n=1 Tax=Dreissena polymorpha TaxID=45954 RepID=A0A9D4JQP4_DREPO|nr:hypothetical protein DPMN_117973 [Dreissena polymorpha]